MLKKLLKIWLRVLAVQVLRKYHPRIVVVTGSAGKTSTKEAILLVLQDEKSLRVLGTKGNRNTEFGVTATIIDPGFVGEEINGRIKLTAKEIWRLTGRTAELLIKRLPYPEILVLELAADHPGDIKYFMSFIQPEVGVLTNIGDAHLEWFHSKSELVEEKSLIITHLKPKGLAVLNKDDDFSKLISRKTNAKKTFISAESEADIWAGDIGFGSKGLHFNAIAHKRITTMVLPVFGYQFVYAALAALAVGDYFKIPWEVMAKRLSQYTVPKRRFEIIKLGDTVVIDDTYNANPASVLAALKSLARLGVNHRKIAILGDMRELGSASDKGHRSVGEYAAKVLDQLWVVGKGGALMKEAAIEAGLPRGQAREFNHDAIPAILRDNSLVLVKGSLAMNMDKIVEAMKEFHERSC